MTDVTNQVGDVDPRAKAQTIPIKGRYVTLYRLHSEDIAACRYIQKCGQTALYECHEEGAEPWYWCGFCEPGRKLS